MKRKWKKESTFPNEREDRNWYVARFSPLVLENDGKTYTLFTTNDKKEYIYIYKQGYRKTRYNL